MKEDVSEVNFEIIVGTYEQFLLGYRINNTGDGYKLEHSFATHSHLASIRNVASKKHYLASAGADDSVYLYDMRHRMESGRLTHHNDTVNSIVFTPDSSHILTCSNDGSIAAIRCGNWQVEKHWKSAHKGSSVNSLSIHPTGKIALSVGGDGVLRTWNLVKGRQAYATNLVPRLGYDARNITVLKWSPEGDKYLLAINARLEIYSVETAGVVNDVNFDSKIVCAEFLDNNLIVIGHEDGKVRLYDLKKSLELFEKSAHDGRVKCVALENSFLATASSSGEVKLWKYAKRSLELLATVNCGARITCMVLALPCEGMVVKKEEVKVEEPVQTRRDNKFRIRQEVIIEDEGEEIETTGGPSAKKSKKKSKKRLKGARASNLVANESEKESVLIGSSKREQKLKRKISELHRKDSPLKMQGKALKTTGDQTPLKKKKKGNRSNGDSNSTIDLGKPPMDKTKRSAINNSARKANKSQQRFSYQNWEVDDAS